ncbi:MAG: protein kinase [Actinobacteria bacterium]|nr:protein kinase [Actinomycetota bacterium]
MDACTSCGGTIEDGYCNACGLAAAPPPAVAAVSAPAPAAVSAPASVSAPGSAPVSAPAPATARLPAGSAAGPGPAASRRIGGGRGSRRTSGKSVRGRLGAGLVEIPPVPYRDPASAVLADPQVPENRRFCANCDQPVGRGRDGKPGLTEGFCRNCGTRFSFRPKLEPGELVAGQYEVLGCLAFGGLGWIYLARDHNVSDRWVVLKGLLNTGDADAMAAAVAERQFLAQVEHPNIVRIYNFVQHADRRTAEPAGYIVMEYVGGKSLKQILQDARLGGGSVPVAHAIAYAIEVLPALGYLHDRGLVYCDFKPDNVIQTEEQLKLIDMGGVRPVDGDGPIYGTVGYQAPEIAMEGPSVSSDLFTVARALAVLTFEFKGYQTSYKFTFPDGVPLLAEQESFARLLRRATQLDPDRRFGSAGEMAEQLTGVLREVLSVEDGVPRAAFSTVFSPELQATGTGDAPDGAAMAAPGAAEIITGMPMPLVDRADPAAGYLATFAGLDAPQRAAALVRAVSGDATVPSEVGTSAETRLALARAMLDVGDEDRAGAVLAELAAEDPSDWRIAWTDGLRRLVIGEAGAARDAFSAVYDELPGELVPKLALAFAAEAAGDPGAAMRYFRLVQAVDRSCISAAFGLARTCLEGGDRPGAIAALAGVPDTSSHHAAAQIAAIRILLSPQVTGDDLRQAAGRLGRLTLDEARRQQLTVEILRAALGWATSGTAPGDGLIAGCEPNERALRFGLERGYRALARLAPDHARRIQLIDQANAIRPKTWA